MSEERPPGHVALIERETVLPLDPTSPRSARRLVREVLSAAERSGWLDAAELAVSEIVTNAVLHAHTEIKIWAAVYDDHVCIEVEDGSPELPLAKHYDAQASTGRGMGLVAAVATECGVRSRGPDGKVIWFCIGDPPPGGSSREWAIADMPLPTDDRCKSVILQAMPPTLWLAARQHHDALLRELALYAAEHDDLTIDFAQVDHARFTISNAVTRAVEEAHEAGRTRPVAPTGLSSPLPWVPDDFDLELAIDPADAPTFLALPDALDLAERLAVAGHLLVLPGLPEIVAVRDWACEQVVAQLAGGPPAPWPGTAAKRFETEVHGRTSPEGDWDSSVVDDSDQKVVAADDANRIIAVSRPLAEALGWDPRDLVGRRVVALIPPALREAHVAGFSRHLSTGEDHILGQTLELPVLHADGREMPADLRIERTGAGQGRIVYLAWIEPKGS